LVPEPFGELYPEFKEAFDHIEILRRGLETRGAYLRRVLQRVTSAQPDMIINNSVPCIQGLLPFMAPNVVRISVVHNVLEYEAKLGLAKGPWVDWAVAVSDNVRALLEQYSGGRVQLATIPESVEIPSARRRREMAANPLRLIYVGRMEQQKNLPGLLHVLSCLSDACVPFNMTMVGSGRELNSTRAQVERSRFGDHVRFLGARSQREVAELLEENDFLLMTSHFEGTPHVILEAMAHGLVVVASRLLGATDRMITHGVDGFLCDRNSPQEYTRILQRVSSTPLEFAAVSRAGRTAVLPYSADALAVEYETLFERAKVGGRPVGGHLGRRIHVPPELLPHFPGILLQCKHRLADVWRRLACGQRPVAWR
jgi:glycosyltransferase involved in cell wall biosynthesis